MVQVPRESRKNDRWERALKIRSNGTFFLLLLIPVVLISFQWYLYLHIINNDKLCNKQRPEKQQRPDQSEPKSSTHHFSFGIQEITASSLSFDKTISADLETAKAAAQETFAAEHPPSNIFKCEAESSTNSLIDMKAVVKDSQIRELSQKYKLRDDLKIHDEFLEKSMNEENKKRSGTEEKLKRDVGALLDNQELLHSIVFQSCREALSKRGTCRTLELGFALGCSTMGILQGHDHARVDLLHSKNSNKVAAAASWTQEHYSVDPFHHIFAYNGARGVSRYLSRHPESQTRAFFVQEPSDVALGEFRKQKTCFDVIFIDANHLFDDNILELAGALNLINIGHSIIMHDMWMPSMNATFAWIATNLNDSVRIIPTVYRPNLVLQKIGPDTRNWDHFEPMH